MNLKHLQLNTSTLKSPEEVFKFILENDIDIACLQEIIYPIDGINPLKKLAEERGYHYEEGLHFEYLPKNQKIAAAIISKYPIIDKTCFYYNSANFEPKKIDQKDSFSGNLIDDKMGEDFEGSRGLKHSQKSRAILICTIQTPEGLVKTLTTHFTVSDLCTETIQMYEMASMITSIVRHSKDLPIIFSTDMNVRIKSFSGEKLKEVLKCHTENFSDTLSKNHIAKQKDFPNGLAIDHTFSKNIKGEESQAIEVDFSNHKAIITDFTL